MGPLNTDPAVALFGGVGHIAHHMLLERFNSIYTRRTTIDELGKRSDIYEINDVLLLPNR